MRLAVVIVNYRTPGLVIDCLDSLQTEVRGELDRVFVVDNASGDDSLNKIQQGIEENSWETWAELLPSPVNGGFSAGNNVGIKAATPEAYLLLNSDTLVRPGALHQLLDALHDHPEVGLIGPRLEWPDQTPQISCFRDRSPLSELITAAQTGPITRLLQTHDVPIPVSDVPIEPDWISFACVLIRRQVIEQIGLMDEGYFMYREDNDYCRRARAAGWKILYWPQAHVVHLRGGSGSVKQDVAARKRPPAYLYASRSRYFTKFYGYQGMLVANLLWICGRSISLTREWAGTKQPHTCKAEAQDIWTNSLNPMKPYNL
ncbi:MAG: glycosyltransferase family 2 protein [Oscillatoriales cyanobacterium RM1_1_9]|nr:glycosyltransferase family 2 protein [Oscillatoriales cyanobacterium SM2_3_0]NJO46417.1 glycosyltransferase family 2 protein [Oscillatoriales cyanobacterium RM2_1_1]NJO71635.1 glycosyltransferase family 2 protein [Oscillatoriales cyanobacterium RM1_1_9]